MRTSNTNHLAILALAHIAENQHLADAILAQTGTTPEQLADGVHSLEIQAGVLDFLLADDTRILAFCEAYQIEPSDILQARHALPGAPHRSGS